MSENNSINDDTLNSSSNKELEEKFNILAHQMSKTYLENTNKRHNEIENKVSEIVKSAEKKISERCEDKINLMLSVSDNQPMLNEQSGQMLVSIKPKKGKEEEYSLYATQLTECAKPYLSLAEQILEYRSFFKQINNNSYQFCIKECKDDLINKNKEGKINFEAVKYCIKDCYNLGSFNFKAYFYYISEGIEQNYKALEKL